MKVPWQTALADEPDAIDRFGHSQQPGGTTLVKADFTHSPSLLADQAEFLSCGKTKDLDSNNYARELPEKLAATMAARAAHVLGINSDGDVVKPARGLYPHQWSWDTAFIAIGLSALDVGPASPHPQALFPDQGRQ